MTRYLQTSSTYTYMYMYMYIGCLTTCIKYFLLYSYLPLPEVDDVMLFVVEEVSVEDDI